MILLRRLRVRRLKHLRDVDIWFPRQGSVLIEGQNESGKSTLFEAIYFALYGSALVTEESGASLAALVPHDAPSAEVELTLLAGETELHIQRTIRQSRGGKPDQRIALTVRHPGGAEPTINTIAAANQRILQELHNLDGNALRNSCLMEQRELDRIEKLDRTAREDAIARLLGLDALRRAQQKLTPTRADETAVQALHQRTEVAALRRLADEAAADEARLAEQLRAVRTRLLVDEYERLLATLADGTAADEQSAEQEAALRERLDRASAIEAVAQRAQTLASDLNEVAAAHERAEAAEAHFKSLDARVGDALPAAAQRDAALARLTPALAESARSQAALRETLRLLTDEAEARAAAESAQAALTAAEREAAEADAAARQSAARDALTRWIALMSADDAGNAARLAYEKLNAAQVRHNAATARVQSLRLAVVGAGVVALALVAAGFAIHALWAVAALAVAGAVGAGLALRAASARARASGETVKQLSGALQEAATSRQASRELAQHEATMTRAGLAVPTDAASGRAVLAGLPDGAIPAAAAEPRARAASAQAEQARAAAQQAAARLDHARSRRTAANIDDARSADAVRRELEAAQAEQTRVAADVAALGVEPSAEAASAARGAAAAELRTLQSLAAERDQARTDAAGLTTDARQRLAACIQAFAALRRDAIATDLIAPAEAGPFETLPALRQAHQIIVARARARLAELDAPGARAEQAAHRVRRETATAQSTQARDHAAHLLAQIATESGIALDDHQAALRAHLAAQWPAFAQADQADPANIEPTRAEADRARQAAIQARTRFEDAARRAHLDGDEAAHLDERVCREQHAAAARDLRQRHLAATLAKEAFARLVRRVLPETEINMRAVLPDLTSGRYRDAQLLHDDQQNADLRIRVWDEVAGRYVARSLFSGGTRDQFSLALRLAFALATLPKELGAIPGFIFLDEPLSSFDAERSRALVHLLTRGTVARHFAQVFLISHSASFDAASFAYRLRMESGRIAESTLPTEAEAAHLWQPEAAAQLL